MLGLSKRQSEVIALVADGFQNKEIADKLKICRRTVEYHRINIENKFNIKGTAQLTKLAVKLNLITLPLLEVNLC